MTTSLPPIDAVSDKQRDFAESVRARSVEALGRVVEARREIAATEFMDDESRDYGEKARRIIELADEILRIDSARYWLDDAPRSVSDWERYLSGIVAHDMYRVGLPLGVTDPRS